MTPKSLFEINWPLDFNWITAKKAYKKQTYSYLPNNRVGPNKRVGTLYCWFKSVYCENHFSQIKKNCVKVVNADITNAVLLTYVLKNQKCSDKWPNKRVGRCFFPENLIRFAARLLGRSEYLTSQATEENFNSLFRKDKFPVVPFHAITSQFS